MAVLYSSKPRGYKIKVGFQLTLSQEVDESISSNQVEVEQKVNPSEEEREFPLPTFGPHQNVNSEYKFKDEVDQLPFKFNRGDAPLKRKQEEQFLNIIYDHKEVFSVHEDNLGFCEKAGLHHFYNYGQTYVLASQVTTMAIIRGGKNA